MGATRAQIEKGAGARLTRLTGTIIGIAVLAALAIAPSIASAAIRYTSPTGSGTACSQASPCSLTDGVNGAVAGDEIRLAADEYRRASELVIATPNLTISGPPGRYSAADFRAFLFFDPPATSATNIRLTAAADDFSIKRVSIVGGAGVDIMINGLLTDGMSLERVRISDQGSQQTVVAQDASISNSVIQQDSGTYGAVGITGAISGSTITALTGRAIVNDDAYHDPDPPFFDYCDLAILNTIAVGAMGNLVTADGGSSCVPNTSYNYSWIPFAAGFGGGGIIDPGGFVTSGANNLSNSPPALASPFSGDVNLALDSPAIDAGCGGSCGVEDFYGRPRPIGVQNDIGATETILPPTISTVGVDSKTYDRAQLSATINPNGGATTYNFQIRKAGPTTWESFDGSTTGEGTLPETVRGTAQPLDPETSYEVRVIGLNSSGVESTSPAVTTFTTDAAPQPVPAAFVQIRSAKAKVTRRAARIQARIRTSGAGRVTLRATPAAGGTKTWCRVRQTVAVAGVHTVSCNLGRKGRTRVRKSALGLVLKASFTDGTNNSAATQRRFTIPRRR